MILSQQPKQNGRLQSNHKVSVAEFFHPIDLFSLRCQDCKATLFQPKQILSLIIWNEQNYLLMYNKYIPDTIIIDSNEKVEMEGNRAHNIYVGVRCWDCKSIIGLVVKGNHFLCRKLKKKLLIEVGKVEGLNRKVNNWIEAEDLAKRFGDQLFDDWTSKKVVSSFEPKELKRRQERKAKIRERYQDFRFRIVAERFKPRSPPKIQSSIDENEKGVGINEKQRQKYNESKAKVKQLHSEIVTLEGELRGTNTVFKQGIQKIKGKVEKLMNISEILRVSVKQIFEKLKLSHYDK